jgi:hypothetical protein
MDFTHGALVQSRHAAQESLRMYSSIRLSSYSPLIGVKTANRFMPLPGTLIMGSGGRINKVDLLEQRNSCSCLTLILACIIYWQAKEINRVVIEYGQEG